MWRPRLRRTLDKRVRGEKIAAIGADRDKGLLLIKYKNPHEDTFQWSAAFAWPLLPKVKDGYVYGKALVFVMPRPPWSWSSPQDGDVGGMTIILLKGKAQTEFFKDTSDASWKIVSGGSVGDFDPATGETESVPYVQANPGFRLGLHYYVTGAFKAQLGLPPKNVYVEHGAPAQPGWCYRSSVQFFALGDAGASGEELSKGVQCF